MSNQQSIYRDMTSKETSICGNGSEAMSLDSHEDLLYSFSTFEKYHAARIQAEVFCRDVLPVNGAGWSLFAKETLNVAIRKEIIVWLFEGNPTCGNHLHPEKTTTGSGFEPANPTTPPSIPPKNRYPH